MRNGFKSIPLYAEIHTFLQKIIYLFLRFAEREIFCGGLRQRANDVAICSFSKKGLSHGSEILHGLLSNKILGFH